MGVEQKFLKYRLWSGFGNWGAGASIITGTLTISSKERWLLHSVRCTASVSSAGFVPVPIRSVNLLWTAPAPYIVNSGDPPATNIAVGGGLGTPPILRVSCPVESPYQPVGWVFDGSGTAHTISTSVDLVTTGTAGDSAISYIEFWFAEIASLDFSTGVISRI